MEECRLSKTHYITDYAAFFESSKQLEPAACAYSRAEMDRNKTAFQTEIKENAKFHSIVAKLLYLGKRGRPDILLPVQFLCTRVKTLTIEDEKKLERVLGY